MPMWRCPHCGTPQAEAARCWVCKRSSTSCGTCRHFRRAIAGQLGYCGLDRHRRPLRGDELRGCWTAVPETVEVAPAAPAFVTPTGRSRLAFVPLDSDTGSDHAVKPAAGSPPDLAAAPVHDPRLGFWGADEG